MKEIENNYYYICYRSWSKFGLHNFAVDITGIYYKAMYWVSLFFDQFIIRQNYFWL